MSVESVPHLSENATVRAKGVVGARPFLLAAAVRGEGNFGVWRPPEGGHRVRKSPFEWREENLVERTAESRTGLQA